MSNQVETLTVNCPLCSSPHVYKLAVEVSFFMSMMVVSSLRTEVGRNKPFTRIFTCPKTKDDFQVRFSIYQEPNTEIRKVTVIGPVEETK